MTITYGFRINYSRRLQASCFKFSLSWSLGTITSDLKKKKSVKRQNELDLQHE